MENELNLLLKLQDLDSALDNLLSEINSVDTKIQEKTKYADSLKSSLKTAKDILVSHQLKKKLLESEAEAQEQKIKKHQGELNSLKSNDAYKAMLHEIDSAKQALLKIEDDTLVVMEQIESAEKDYKSKDQKVKSDENVVKAEINNEQSKRDSLLADEKSRRSERDAFSVSVPEKLRSHYDAIRNKRGGMAIVPILNNTCSGCRMTLTPSRGIEAKKAKTMLVCDSCSCILYLPKDTPVEAPLSDKPIAAA